MFKVARAFTFVSLFTFPLFAFAADAANLAGPWKLSMTAPRGTTEGTLRLQQDGTKLSGNYNGPRGESPVTGNIDGNSVSFHLEFKAKRTVTIAFSGNLDGDKMSGTFVRQAGGSGGHHNRNGNKNQTNRAWTATRQQNNSPSQDTNQ
jgi:hypothetical protein